MFTQIFIFVTITNSEAGWEDTYTHKMPAGESKGSIPLSSTSRPRSNHLPIAQE